MIELLHYFQHYIGSIFSVSNKNVQRVNISHVHHKSKLPKPQLKKKVWTYSGACHFRCLEGRKEVLLLLFDACWRYIWRRLAGSDGDGPRGRRPHHVRGGYGVQRPAFEQRPRQASGSRWRLRVRPCHRPMRNILENKKQKQKHETNERITRAFFKNRYRGYQREVSCNSSNRLITGPSLARGTGTRHIHLVFFYRRRFCFLCLRVRTLLMWNAFCVVSLRVIKCSLRQSLYRTYGDK